MSVHTPHAARHRLIQEGRATNPSAAALARQKGLVPHTFRRWIAVEARPQRASIAVQVGGHHFQFEGLPPPTWLGQSLRGLLACCTVLAPPCASFSPRSQSTCILASRRDARQSAMRKLLTPSHRCMVIVPASAVATGTLVRYRHSAYNVLTVPISAFAQVVGGTPAANSTWPGATRRRGWTRSGGISASASWSSRPQWRTTTGVRLACSNVARHRAGPRLAVSPLRFGPMSAVFRPARPSPTPCRTP
jgi:hypothetical protein